MYNQNAAVTDSVVSFNVGGALFATTVHTLLKEPLSFLARVARGVAPCTCDEQGVYFVDRDPKHFQLLLNFLRDGFCMLPSTADGCMELMQEAKFYQLASFEAWARLQGIMLHHQSTSSHPATDSPQDTGMPTPIQASQHTLFTPSASLTSTPMAKHAGGPTPAPIPTHSGTYASFEAQQHPHQQQQGMPHCNIWQFSPTKHAPAATHTYKHVGVASRLFTSSSTATSAPGIRDQGNGSGAPASACKDSIRDVFMKATAAAPSKLASPAYALPQVEDVKKWTSKYLHADDGVFEVVNTLLELAFLLPHKSFHTGKILLSISSDCAHDQASSLMGSTLSYLKSRNQTVRVIGASGWACEFVIRPSSDVSLFDKYNIAESVQDNWFVLCAVLKDQFGVVLEEDISRRPACPACRRTHLAVTLHKIL